MDRRLYALFVAAAAVAVPAGVATFTGCSLNPQPLPPYTATDDAGLSNTVGGSPNDAAPLFADAQVNDAPTSTPPAPDVDGGVTDASNEPADGATDAATDAEPDAAAEDASADAWPDAAED